MGCPENLTRSYIHAVARLVVEIWLEAGLRYRDRDLGVSRKTSTEKTLHSRRGKKRQRVGMEKLQEERMNKRKVTTRDKVQKPRIPAQCSQKTRNAHHKVS